MNASHSGTTASVWMTGSQAPDFQPLSEDLAADVCIIGAGIAGLTTAYLLACEGRSVVVVDDGPIVSGETERTSAHLASALDDRFIELERMHGAQGSRLAAESHAAAIDQIESIVHSEQIDCDFQRVDGYLFAAAGESPEVLERELAAARRAGLAVEAVARAPIPSFDTGRALRFANQAQFHPVKYLAAVARALVARGVRIFIRTHATSVDDGQPARATFSNGKAITAREVVVATNSPVNDRVTMHSKQAAYRTYVIGARVPAGSVPFALYWDTADPYHYVRLQQVREPSGANHDLLLVGGEDHKTGQDKHPEERFARLERWTSDRFRIGRVDFRWSGQVLEPADALAFIGRNPGERHVYIATGDSGHGLTHGTIAGILLTDLIQGRTNPWTTLYDPARKPLRSLVEYARENLNVAAQYADYATPGDMPGGAPLAPGTGAVIRRGTRKVAVYCDETGQRHECSAICPHLGCVVSWNPVEQSWDCPCHGSRFDPIGEVICGPATQGLSRHEVESTAEPLRA